MVVVGMAALATSTEPMPLVELVGAAATYYNFQTLQ